MAATIATAYGIDRSRTKEAHRLGSQAARCQAATWRTFADVSVNADGSGSVEVKRDGVVIHSFEFGPEEARS